MMDIMAPVRALLLEHYYQQQQTRDASAGTVGWVGRQDRRTTLLASSNTNAATIPVEEH